MSMQIYHLNVSLFFNVISAGIHSTVTVDTSNIPIDDSIYVIQYPSLALPYTVVSSSEEEGKYTTTCLKFDNHKFDFIDRDYFPPDQRHTIITKFVNNPVVITPADITLKNNDTFNVHADISLKWTHDDSDNKKHGKKTTCLS